VRLPRAAAAAVVLAALVRAGFAVLFLRHPVSDIVPQDMPAYVDLARAIRAGQWRDPLFDYVNPPYAFVLAPFVSLPPDTATRAVIAVQIVCEAATVWLLAAAAASAFGRRAGALAAALYALYGPAIYYTAIVLPVTLTILALAATMAAFLAVPRARTALTGGLALGVLVLSRPNASLMIPVLLVWRAAQARSAGERASFFVRRAAWMGAGLALVLAPFALRSGLAGGSWSPFPANGGINFYIGNHEQATGLYVHVPGVADRPVEQVASSVAEASRRSGRHLEARAASAFWVSESWRYASAHRAGELRLLLLKAWYFVRSEEMTLNISYNLAREELRPLQAALGFGLVWPFAAWGIAAVLLVRGVGRTLEGRLVVAMLVAYAASVILFFVSDRYRLPVLPLVMALAAHGTLVLFDDLRGRRWRRLLAGLAVVAAAAVLGSWKLAPFRFYDPMPRFQLAAAYYGRGDVDRGLAECERGLAMVPLSPQGLYCRASGHYYKKDYYAAERGLRRTIAGMGVFDMPARQNLAVVYEDVGLYEEALRVTDDDEQRAHLESAYADFRRRTDLATFAREQREVGEKALAEGRASDARYAFKRALEAQPGETTVRAALVRACAALGWTEDGCF
jgi:tetratricopeptide (TPR) repeat protein